MEGGLEEGINPQAERYRDREEEAYLKKIWTANYAGSYGYWLWVGGGQKVLENRRHIENSFREYRHCTLPFLSFLSFSLPPLPSSFFLSFSIFFLFLLCGRKEKAI